MEIKNLINIQVKNFNVFTLISLLLLLAGIAIYLWWGSTFGVWYDIGIYSLTIVLILAGIFGALLSLHEKQEE